MSALSPKGPLFSFAIYTDVLKMKERWQKFLPDFLGKAVQLKSCCISCARCRIYLSPASWGKSFLAISYELEHEEENYGTKKSMLYGKAYLENSSTLIFQKLVAQAEHQEKPCNARYISELDMIVWCFPDDPSLPQLTELIDKERVIHYLPYSELPFASHEDIVDIQVTVVRYRPEERCILRYNIVYGVQRREHVLYAKTFNSNKGEQVFNHMQLCSIELNEHGDRTPKSIAYHPEIRTVWQEELCGLPLLEKIDKKINSSVFEKIGRTLARFQSLNMPHLESVTCESRVVELIKKAEKLAQAFPVLALPLADIVTRTQTELRLLLSGQETVIHGDMHVGQFLLTSDDRIGFLDFDGCSYGDPAQDLADFIVDPHLSVSERADLERNCLLSADNIKIFLKSYRAHASWQVEDIAIKWHARIQLVNKAYRAAITQMPYWQEKVPELVYLASDEEMLGDLIRN